MARNVVCSETCLVVKLAVLSCRGLFLTALEVSKYNLERGSILPIDKCEEIDEGVIAKVL